MTIMKFGRQIATLSVAAMLLAGCSTQSSIDNATITPDLPSNWQQAQLGEDVNVHRLSQTSNPQLAALVYKALSNNRSLKQQAYGLAIQEQQVDISKADLWPEIDFSLNSSRQASGDPTSYSNNNSLAVDVSYEIDIWGKLSDATKQDHLTYLASKANYLNAKNQLISDVLNSYFELVSAQQLHALFKQRVDLSKENLDIISSGYKQGLNEALDVYLARNDLNAELSSLANQQARVQQASAAIEQLVGDYPAGTLVAANDIPILLDNLDIGVPSTLIKKRPSLQASWYELLAQDAALAFAHKQRFPSIRLSGSYGTQANELDDLLSGSSIAWSLLGGISAPLFNAGQLKAVEEQQALRLKQNEQAYLDSMFQAFAEIEQGITQEKSIKTQYNSTLAAKENAMIAQTLAFEQYQNGLVSYTTVLDAQERAFNAQSNVISLKNQLITNRINLYVALGGDFTDGLIKNELTNEN